MEKQYLKVGQTFKVVEVLNHNFDYNQFKIGGHTISFTDANHLLNGDVNYDGYYQEFLGQKTLCLPLGADKVIGKLTITKVK